MRIRVLKCYLAQGVPAAQSAQIARVARDGKDFYQIATLDGSSRVVEIFEFPAEWGIWTGLEWLMSYDVKASGRTTNAYDQSGGHDFMPEALRIMSMVTGAALSPRQKWKRAYRSARTK